MFTNLIESESHRGDFKRRGRFVLFTTAVYAVLFVFAGVLSIYAYDAQLETQDQELTLLEFVPPVAPAKAIETVHSPNRTASHSTGPERPARLPELFESSANPRTPPRDIGVTASLIPPAPHGAIRDPNHFDLGSGPATPGPTGPSTGGNSGPVVRDAGEVIPPPIKPTVVKPRVVHREMLRSQAISLPEPPYPMTAKQMRIQGAVTVQVLLDEGGKVISAHSVSGNPLLAASAVKAAYQARFTPTVLDGTPVKVSGVITYNFMLR